MRSTILMTMNTLVFSPFSVILRNFHCQSTSPVPMSSRFSVAVMSRNGKRGFTLFQNIFIGMPERSIAPKVYTAPIRRQM